MNYLIYPFRTMKITQSYTNGNHIPHTKGKPKDFPLDEAGVNNDRDYFYCPCNEIKITKLYGNQTVGYHIWLESTSKVNLANGKSDYITIMAVHSDYDDYSKLRVGQIFKRTEPIFREGTSGNTTGNHIHFSIGLGKSSSNGIYWKQNSKGSWVLVAPRGSIKPEQAFFVDTRFTTVKNSKKLKFKELEGENDMTRGYFKKGDANEGVYALKQMLIQLKSLGKITQGVNDDDIFGAGTETAVKQVQKAAKITVDGCAGKVTLRACRTLINDEIKAKENYLSSIIKNLSIAESKINKAKNILM